MKDYVRKLMEKNGLGYRLPNLKDYKNNCGSIPSPDDESEVEYCDFVKLIHSWNRGYTVTGPCETKKCEITLNGVYRLGGDMMITGWLSKYGLNSDWGKYITGEIDGDSAIVEVLEKEFIPAISSPGNYIFWPRHAIPTVNTERGKYKGPLKDRIDFTFESLRRWYKYRDKDDKVNIPLKSAFENRLNYYGGDKGYFDLFKSFDEFVEFFKIECFMKDNKTSEDRYSVLDLSISNISCGDIIILDDNCELSGFPSKYGCFIENAIHTIRERTARLLGVDVVKVIKFWQTLV